MFNCDNCTSVWQGQIETEQVKFQQFGKGLFCVSTKIAGPRNYQSCLPTTKENIDPTFTFDKKLTYGTIEKQTYQCYCDV